MRYKERYEFGYKFSHKTTFQNDGLFKKGKLVIHVKIRTQGIQYSHFDKFWKHKEKLRILFRNLGIKIRIIKNFLLKKFTGILI